MPFMRINPRMPNVEGITLDIHCQKSGMALCGHDTPDMNRNGSDVNTTSRMTFSRYLTAHDTIIAKNMHDRI